MLYLCNMMKTMTKTIMLAALLLIGGQTAFAFQADTTKTDTVKTDSVKVENKVAKKHECCEDTTVKDHKDPYHKIVKEGGSMREGLFTVRHIKDDWYLEVPDELLGRMLLCVTRFISVPQDFKMFSGEEVNRSAVYLEQYNEKSLFLREYVQSSYAKPEDRIAISLRQSTVDPIVYKFDVIGRNPNTKAQLINVTKWLMSDNKVTSFSGNDRTSLGIGGMMNDRSFIDSIKTYPINIEIQTLRTYSMNPGRAPASRTGSATLSLNTSIVLLPETPMQPRYEDERVGYFNNRITEFSDEQQTTKHEAIVMRYRLEPKDHAAYKAGKLVEPKKQIVFYIDPATPKKWAKYLKLGIEDWNVAFEAAGFKNAIVAKDWPNDPSMSLDDARFSVVRYLPSETENAYGPRIVDPRSGEIIEAHICWYHSVMQLLKKWYMVQCGPLDKRAQKMDFPDELMGQLIRFVSSHEVGHSLGLRHNMIASYATPVEKLRDKKWVEQHGHTASIMDYARFNWVAQPEDYLSSSGQDSTEVMFDWVTDYINRHQTIAAPREFHLTDEEFADFKQKVVKSGFTYDPVSQKQLKQLEKTAKAEGYYEQAKEAFKLLESKLKHDVATDIDKHEDILRQMIELDIISAYYYQAGSIEAGLQYDRQLKEAIRLLQQPEAYKKLLTPKKSA